jgi:methyltransferase family protein
MVELIVSDSHRDELREIGEFHLLFIDGDHTREGALADLDKFFPRLQAGGRPSRPRLLPRDGVTAGRLLLRGEARSSGCALATDTEFALAHRCGVYRPFQGADGVSHVLASQWKVASNLRLMPRQQFALSPPSVLQRR